VSECPAQRNEIVEAIKQGRTICVVEGEKDADTCWALGIAATCSAHGAHDPSKNQKPKWYPVHSEQLRGGDICVLNDNDIAGHEHAETTCKTSVGVAKRIRRLDLKAMCWPDMPLNADVSDWIERGHSRDESLALIEQAPDYAEPPKKDEDEHVDEDKIALEFSALHADDMRYVSAWGRWYKWKSGCWRHETTLQAFDDARVLVRAAPINTKAQVVSAVVTLARADRRQAATTEQWDTDPWLLGTPGGTVDLRAGKMRAAQPLDYITKLTAVTPQRMPIPLWDGAAHNSQA
jgi:putative DNA primase/helicase